MTAAAAAVSLWQRRVGPCGGFDRDDAAQEAAISAWRIGERATTTTCYRDILDAMDKFIVGFAQRNMLLLSGGEHPDYEAEPSSENPEQTVYVREVIAKLEDLCPTDYTICEAMVAGEPKHLIAKRLGKDPTYVSWRLREIKNFVADLA